jgi:hypothetical protein
VEARPRRLACSGAALLAALFAGMAGAASAGAVTPIAPKPIALTAGNAAPPAGSPQPIGGRGIGQLAPFAGNSVAAIIKDPTSGEGRQIFVIEPNGITRLVAGTGARGCSGDNGPAAAAEFTNITGIARTGSGSILVADQGCYRVREIGLDGIVRVQAGTGGPPSSSEPLATGEPAESVPIVPNKVVPMPGGQFLVSSVQGQSGRLQQVSTMSDTMNTRTMRTSSGEQQAVPAPADFVLDADNASLIAAYPGRSELTRVSPSGEMTPIPVFGLRSVSALAQSVDGSLLIADPIGRRVIQRNPVGVATPVAGNGQSGIFGVGAPATLASIDAPQGVVGTPNGETVLQPGFASGNGGVFAVNAKGILRRVANAQGTPVPPPPDPVQGRSEVVVPLRAPLSAKFPGSKRFIGLEEATSIPNGTQLNVTRGQSVVRTAADASASTEDYALLSEGVVKTNQGAGQALTSISFGQKLTCPRKRSRRQRRNNRRTRRATKSLAVASARRKAPRARAAVRRRRVRVNARGRFRTDSRRGRVQSTGTVWLVDESCTRTVIRLEEGSITVRDLVRRKLVRLKAPARYVIPNSVPRRRR